MSSRQIPARVVKELYAKSGNCCAFSGCNEQLRNLLNTNYALGLSGEERREIYIFAESLDYVMQEIAMNSYSNGNRIAIPNYKEDDFRIIRERLKNLHREYVKYRFGNI